MARGQTTFFANVGITPGNQDTFQLTLCTFVKGNPRAILTREELAWLGQNMVRIAGAGSEKPPAPKPKRKTVTVTVSLDDDDDGLDMV